jgi:hypothetical protein
MAAGLFCGSITCERAEPSHHSLRELDTMLGRKAFKEPLIWSCKGPGEAGRMQSDLVALFKDVAVVPVLCREPQTVVYVHNSLSGKWQMDSILDEDETESGAGSPITENTCDSITAILRSGNPDVLGEEDWGAIREARFRAGLHAGHAEIHAGDFSGAPVTHAC